MPQVWQSGLPGRNETSDKVQRAVFIRLFPVPSPPASPTHLKETPAISNMSLAAVVSLLSWYLSDMKMTSFIPSKATMEEISLWARRDTATGTRRGAPGEPGEPRFLSGPAHAVRLLTPVSAAFKYGRGLIRCHLPSSLYGFFFK